MTLLAATLYLQLTGTGALFGGGPEMRAHLMPGLRAGVDLGPVLSAELAVSSESDVGGTEEVSVETTWLPIEARAFARFGLAKGLEAGLGASLLLDAGSTELRVSSFTSTHTRWTLGAGTGGLLRFRGEGWELRADVAWALWAGRLAGWATLGAGLWFE